MVLATLITAEMLVCDTDYDKKTIANVWQFVGSLGLSKADLSNELRSRLDSMAEPSAKDKPEKPSKRKRQDPEEEKSKKGNKDKKKRKQ